MEEVTGWDRDAIDKFCNLLEQSSTMQDGGSRTDLVNGLHKDIRANIRRRNDLRGDIHQIVETCSNYHNGIEQLLQVLARREGDSSVVQKARAFYYRQSKAKEMEMPTDDLPNDAPFLTGRNVPHRMNRSFVGRKQELLQLAKLLKAGQHTAITPAMVAGYGGIGKTQLAVEFAHRFGQFYAGGVYWLNASSLETLASEIANCIDDDQPQANRLKQMLRLWEEPTPRLLIFDNVDSLTADELDHFLPKMGGCRLLITTRRTSWAGTNWDVVRLDTLEPAESVKLLQSLCPRLNTAEAGRIADELGHFPLALYLAGCYLQETNGTVAHFLAHYADKQLQHPALQGKGSDFSPTKHELSVSKTFALSWQRLDPHDPNDAEAIRWLARCACCASGLLIPQPLLARIAQEAGEEVEEMGIPFKRLGQLGLLYREEGGVQLHRLIQLFVQTQTEQATAQGEVERGAIALAFEQLNAGYPAALRAWVEQLNHLTEQALPRDDDQAATLANNLAALYDAQGEFGRARPLFERALAILHTKLGAHHPTTQIVAQNLAACRRALGGNAGKGGA